MKIIAYPHPMPFHGLAPNIMNEHVYFELRDAGIDSRARVMSLKVNRESKFASPPPFSLSISAYDSPM